MVKKVKGQQSFQAAGTASAKILGPTDAHILQCHKINPPSEGSSGASEDWGCRAGSAINSLGKFLALLRANFPQMKSWSWEQAAQCRGNKLDPRTHWSLHPIQVPWFTSIICFYESGFLECSMRTWGTPLSRCAAWAACPSGSVHVRSLRNGHFPANPSPNQSLGYFWSLEYSSY